MANFYNSSGASAELERKASARPGTKPNFALIVVVASVLLLLILLGSWLFVGADGRHLLPGLRHDPHPTSRLAVDSDGLLPV